MSVKMLRIAFFVPTMICIQLVDANAQGVLSRWRVAQQNVCSAGGKTYGEGATCTVSCPSPTYCKPQQCNKDGTWQQLPDCPRATCPAPC
jgi:hypothetical protein